MTTLATTLQLFFSDRLIRQRQVSPNTLQAYRDTLRLLLVFASERYSKVPAKLDIDDLDSPLIGAFLDHLERDRKNSVRTRNARLAAIRSLFRYAALRHPEHAATIERVLAIPPKRFERRLVTYLSEGKSRPYWPRRIGQPGPGGATWPCSASRSRLDFEHPNSSDCAAAMCILAQAHMWVVMARDVRRGSHH